MALPAVVVAAVKVAKVVGFLKKHWKPITFGLVGTGIASGLIVTLIVALVPILVFTQGQAAQQAAAGTMSCAGTIGNPTSGGESTAKFDAVQTKHIREIIGVAKGRGINTYGQIIGIATALQESHFYNQANPKVPESLRYPNDLPVGTDNYSVGIFQQQTGPVFGYSWGTPENLMKPAYAAGRFYDAMVKVPNWQNTPLGVVAQTVQVSGYPERYAKWQGPATDIVNANQDAPAIKITTAVTAAEGGGGCASVGGYINPIQKGLWAPARTDEGVDWVPLKPDVPVLAIGDGVVTVSEPFTPWWPGYCVGGGDPPLCPATVPGACVVYTLTSGAKKGFSIYVAEHMNNLVPVNTKLKAGDVIARAQPGYAWTEWGFAKGPGTCSPWAYPSYPGGLTPWDASDDWTFAGLSMARFFNELGAKTLYDPAVQNPGYKFDHPVQPQGQ